MKFSRTVFLALLLAGLGGAYFFSSRSGPAGGAASVPTKLLAVSPGDFVSSLEIENRVSKDAFTLLREEGGWVLLPSLPSGERDKGERVQYPAENFLVEGMVSALTMSQRVKRFPADENQETEFGLNSPKIRIGVTTQKDPTRRFLLLGDEAPVGGEIYGRWEGENEIFLISFQVKAALERSVYSLRQKKLFRVNWEAVTSIEARVGKQKFRLAKEGEKWRGAAPAANDEIPAEKVLDLIYAFRSLYVKEFLDGREPSLPEFGLGERANYLALEAAGETEKLILGKRVPAKDAFYARREKENLVVLVAKDNVGAVIKNLRGISRERMGDGNQNRPPSGEGADSGSGREGPEKSG